MWSPIIVTIFLVFAMSITLVAFNLGKTKTDNPQQAAAIGFLLSFLPPFAVIYIAILMFKEEVDIV